MQYTAEDDVIINNTLHSAIRGPEGLFYYRVTSRARVEKVNLKGK
jgi:hypothetical protein